MDPPLFCAIDRTNFLEYNDNAMSVADRKSEVDKDALKEYRFQKQNL